MSFIEFTAKHTRNLDRATVSINKGGRIVFSQRCLTDYLKGYPFIKLYYDPDKRVIGIKPVREESPHAYPVTVAHDGKSASISCIAFFKYFDIEDTGRKMDTRWNKDTQIIEARELVKGAPQQKSLFDR
jgi:hypothetical protein